jgi:hypothetical protein
LGEEAAPYVQTYMAVDPASGLAGRDAIGVGVLGVTATGLGVIRHLEGVRGPDKLQNITRVAQIAKHFEVTSLVVEELADGLFGETLENHLLLVEFPMMVEKVTTGGQQKGRRIIETLAPPMGNGRLVMLEKVARSDHGGEFVSQLVRITWDGRTGKAKDHDDIVDALAHAVKKAKGSLVSDIAENRGEVHAAKMDDWRGVPLRYGGLGADSSAHPKARRLALGGQLEDDLPMGEALLEEDREVVRLEERKAHLQEQLGVRTRRGVDPDYLRILRKKIIGLDKTIRELKEHQVL